MVLFSRRPTVSVILASYNHVAFIEEALKSVLEQTMSDLECIVVDDGSTDCTPDRVAAIHDPRVKLIRLSENRRWHPRNIGLSKARGKYIAFQNSDDCWEPEKLAKQIAALEQQPLAVASFTGVNIIDAHGHSLEDSFMQNVFTTTNRSSTQWLRQFFYKGNCLCISSAVIRRSALKKTKLFQPHLIQLSDLDLWVRLAAIGEFHIIPDPLTSMRIIGNQNLSANTPASLRSSTLEYADVLQRFIEMPIGQLRTIFPTLKVPDTLLIPCIAESSWQLSPSHALFAHSILSSLLDHSKKREELVEYFGTEIIHRILRQRSMLQITLPEKTLYDRSVEKTQSWFQDVLQRADFHVTALPLNQSNHWSLRDGAIVHDSKKFFRIIGLEWQTTDGGTNQQPFIDQREIGILGFLLRLNNGTPELLVQAKIEPGNTGIVQLAPTCQATDSNLQRIHGGTPPPFSGIFTTMDQPPIYDAPQSEQGSRFYHKRNRNILIQSTENDMRVPESHQWIPVDTLLDLSQQTYLLNTDARSVLICSPWEVLVDRKPFTRYQDEFGIALGQSAAASINTEKIQRLKSSIEATRAHIPPPTIIDIQKMSGWQCDETSASPISGDSLAVRHITVKTRGREVSEWDQPIIESRGEGKVILYCAQINGVLQFLFTSAIEPGLYNSIQLHPSVVVLPGTKTISSDSREDGSIIRAECRQSEEGGRFFHDVNLFQIREIENQSQDDFWLTLSEIRVLLNEPGWFTNESRSALSLLLRWM